MAAIEELGGLEGAFPIPNSFPQDLENQDYNYVFLGFNHDGSEPPAGRWSEGTSIDGKGTFSSRPMEPEGEEPTLAKPHPEQAPQSEQL